MAAGHSPLVTLQLFSVAPARLPRVLWHMATDRRRLRCTPGLRFHKSLGTGDGTTFDVRDADPTTWGLLTVWNDAAAREAFMASSSVAAAWQALGRDSLRLDLMPVLSRGAWSGTNPFLPTTRQTVARDGGPVAAITRARLRPGRAVVFWRATPPVTRTLQDAPGLLLSVAIGEAPVGVQGTVSVWRDDAALRAFAYGSAAHRRVIDDTVRIGWYAEDLFARFVVEHHTGRLHGRDPLAGTGGDTGLDGPVSH